MAKKKKPATETATPDLSYIVESLRKDAVPIGDLVPDPANARTHDETNLAAIAGSLRAYGQDQPIVVNKRDSIVIKGNGRLAAAKSLGWTHIAVTWVDDDPAKAAGRSIADNRAAELAQWDKAALEALLPSLSDEGDEDLAAAFNALAVECGIVPGEEKAKPERKDVEFQAQQKFQLLIDCKDEAQQLELIEKFTADGLECRALTV